MVNKLPIEINQEIEIVITGLNHQGEGVGRFDGVAVFVAGALPREEVRVKIIEVKKNFARGKVLEVLKPSENRVEERCPHYTSCGGCQFQHFAYSSQLKAKTQLVKDVFKRIGKLEVEVSDTIGMVEPWEYRNKVHFQVGKNADKVVLGFFGEDAFKPVGVENCLLVDSKVNELAKVIEKLLNKYKVEPYNWKTKQGFLRNVMIKRSLTTGEIMVVFIAVSSKWKEEEQLVSGLEAFGDIKSILLNVNPGHSRQVLGKEFILLKGKKQIMEQIGRLKFKLSAPAFFQVNPIQTKVLYDKALEYCNLTGKEQVVDAYCGIGTISLFLAQRAQQVLGIEIVPEAIEDAKENALINGIANAKFVVGRVEKELPRLVAEGLKAEVVVLDPPRKGCDPEVVEAITKVKPARVVYVSCDPATLARDCRLLVDVGYEVKEVQPVDMFPWTGHVETVVLMSRVDK